MFETDRRYTRQRCADEARFDEGRCLVTQAAGPGKQCRFGVNSENDIEEKTHGKNFPDRNCNRNSHPCYS